MKKYFHYLKLNLKMVSTWLIPSAFSLGIIVLMFAIPWIIANKPISFYLLFVDSNANSWLIFVVTMFSIIFGITKTYNLFLSKKLENKKDFKAKFLTLTTLSFLFCLINWIILTAFFFSTEHYKTIKDYVLFDVSYFIVPFIGTLFLSMIFLFFCSLVTKKLITIPIIATIFTFFAILSPSITDRTFGGNSLKEYNSYWIDDKTRIDYYEKFIDNKIYFIPYYLSTNQTINLLNKDNALTNKLINAIENRKNWNISKGILTYLLPTSYISNSLDLDLNLKYIYENYEGEVTGKDIGFNNLNKYIQNQRVLETTKYYKEIGYANVENVDSLKISSTDIVYEIIAKINTANSQTFINTKQNFKNYFYFELKNKIYPKWTTYLILISETFIFSGLVYYLVDKKERLENIK